MTIAACICGFGYSVWFQIWNKGLRYILYIPKQIWLLGSPRIPHLYLAYPGSNPELSSPRGCTVLSPEALPYIIQTFWLPNCFVLLFSWFLSPISSLISLSWPSSVWSCLLWILPNVPASTFSLLSTINVRSPPPHLRAPLSFPFLFIRFHLFTDNMARPRLQNTNSWSCV